MTFDPTVWEAAARELGIVLEDPAPGEFITVDELANLLRCHKRRAYRLVEAGYFEAFRRNGRFSKILISRRSVDDYIRREIQLFQADGAYRGTD